MFARKLHSVDIAVGNHRFPFITALHNPMIKTVFYPGNYSRNIDISMLLLRLAAGAFMLTHGMGKFSKLFGDAPIKFADPIGLGEPASLALVVFSEVLCSILLILGLATRLAAIPLIITMLVIVFISHAGDEFGEVELPLLYTAIYVVLGLNGAGKYSVDQLIYNKMVLREPSV